MPTRTARAEWKGTLKEGRGTVATTNGGFEGPYTFASRFESGDGTNPEELLGAAHASCMAMYLSLVLGRDGYPPESIQAEADVTIDEVDGAPTVTTSRVRLRATVPGIDQGTFDTLVQEAKTDCPISKALAVPNIVVEAELSS